MDVKKMMLTPTRSFLISWQYKIIGLRVVFYQHSRCLSTQWRPTNPQAVKGFPKRQTKMLPHSVKVMKEMSWGNKSTEIFRHISLMYCLVLCVSRSFFDTTYEGEAFLFVDASRAPAEQKAIRWRMKIYVHDYAINRRRDFLWVIV